VLGAAGIDPVVPSPTPPAAATNGVNGVKPASAEPPRS
jgi:hypothetical protein